MNERKLESIVMETTLWGEVSQQDYKQREHTIETIAHMIAVGVVRDECTITRVRDQMNELCSLDKEATAAQLEHTDDVAEAEARRVGHRCIRTAYKQVRNKRLRQQLFIATRGYNTQGLGSLEWHLYEDKRRSATLEAGE